MSTTKTTKKTKTKVKDLEDNGELGFDAAQLQAGDQEETEQLPSGNHIEIPEHPNYSMVLKRKQNNDKMFLELSLLGPKSSKDFQVKLEYPDYDMSVPDLIDNAIQSLQSYKKDYSSAQKRALIVNPSLQDFFLV